MKAITIGLPAMLLLFAMVGDISIAGAQKSPSAKEVAIKKLVDNQQYVFHAQSLIPTGGRQRFLTTDYTVYVSKDSIVSDLPFFGRSYSAPVNPAEGGIKFTSVDFNYTITPARKNGWNVLVSPKDATNAQRFNLRIFDNGTASLQVTSVNRQPISFNGYIS